MNTRINSFLRSAIARTIIAVGAAAATLGSANAQQVNIPAWRMGSEHRAMKLQRELAADMRQDQSLILGSHNSYNSSAYGLAVYPNSQHSYTLFEQLDLGLRSLDLDVHATTAYPNELYLSHALCSGAGVQASQQTLYDGLAEIRSWLNNNPDEVIFLNIEQHFPMTYPSAYHTRMKDWIEKFLGGADAEWGPDVLIRPSEIDPTDNFDVYGQWESRADYVNLMSLSELRALGRVLIMNIGGVSNPCNQHYYVDYPFQNFMLGDLPGIDWCGTDNWTYVTPRTSPLLPSCIATGVSLHMVNRCGQVVVGNTPPTQSYTTTLPPGSTSSMEASSHFSSERRFVPVWITSALIRSENPWPFPGTPSSSPPPNRCGPRSGAGTIGTFLSPMERPSRPWP